MMEDYDPVEDGYPLAAWVAYVENIGEDYADAVGFKEAYNGEWGSERQFAEAYADSIGFKWDSVWPQSCIDWGLATRELMYDYWSEWHLGGGVYIFRNI